MKFYVGTFLLCFLFAVNSAFSQCPSGVLGISGAGCGCLNGCDLTSLGGPNCSPAVSGSCATQLMTVSIAVPAGCTYTVTATIQNRPNGCSSSGADGSDSIKVDESGGTKTPINGASNSAISDSYTLAGPGTIVIEGYVNRADEILTYSTTFSGPACVNCMSVLPVELSKFNAFYEGKSVACQWETETELNSAYFTIEKSVDGKMFEFFTQVAAAGNSTTRNSYKIYDVSPQRDKTLYYKLLQTDKDGVVRDLGVRSIKPNPLAVISVFPNPSQGAFSIQGDEEYLKTVSILDVSGRPIEINSSKLSENTILVEGLPSGVYFVRFIVENEWHVLKAVVSC